MIFTVLFKKTPYFRVIKYSPILFSRSFVVLPHIFSSTINLEWNLICEVITLLWFWCLTLSVPAWMPSSPHVGSDTPLQASWLPPWTSIVLPHLKASGLNCLGKQEKGKEEKRKRKKGEGRRKGKLESYI